MAAPIVLFVYNRPEHTLQVLESLRSNRLAAQSPLIVFADGPKNQHDRLKVEEVRKTVLNISGFYHIETRLSESNRGLARSIIDGVTEVINEYGRVIVLEDDLVVSPHFLDYMNDALDFYADFENVMNINGYWFPVEAATNPETFFLRYPSSWGWATWKRAWCWYKKDPETLKATFSDSDRLRFNLDGTVDIWEQVVHNLKGKANTWAVFWYAAIFRKNGLCLYPRESLVQNIGMDGSGQHCIKTELYTTRLSAKEITQFTTDFKENPEALASLKKFYKNNKMSKIERFIRITFSRLSKSRKRLN
jgi:hypothetical protein